MRSSRFASHYRPLWLGLGALAFDLLLALIVTSLCARGSGLRAWRGVHWARLRVLAGGGAARPGHRHRRALGVAAGGDRRCVAGGVVVALAARLLRGWPARAGLRVGGSRARRRVGRGHRRLRLQGPLRRAGRAARARRRRCWRLAHAAAGHPPGRAPPAPRRLPVAPRDARTARRDGTARASTSRRGSHVAGAPAARSTCGSTAEPSPAAGSRWRRAASRSVRASSPDLYRGRVVALSGNRVVARLAAPGARAVLLRLVLRIDAGGAVAGTATRAGGRAMSGARALCRGCCAGRAGRRHADPRPAPARPRPAARVGARRRRPRCSTSSSAAACAGAAAPMSPPR